LKQNSISRLGICQWFHYEAYSDVERAVALMRELGVRQLRTGISWADFHRDGGREFYDWQMEMLREFDVLLSIWHTPPSLSENGKCSGPPRRLEDYGEFVAYVIELYGDRFSAVELWNEPNNRYKWEFAGCDPEWRKFASMVKTAAAYARRLGKTTVLGGMIPIDHHWLELMASYGTLEDVEVVGVHAFPGMWWHDAPNWDWHSHWRGWNNQLEYIAGSAGGRPIWVTETGLATWSLGQHRTARFDLQVEQLREAAAAPAERTYWYSLVDLDPAREAIEGYHVDENEYHLGLVTHGGTRKPAFAAMAQLVGGATVARSA
jgi:CDP-paratose 2-epimerase